MTEKKLIHFNSDLDYQSLKNDIDGSSIVFVKDSHKIVTHGVEYLFLGWSILEPSLFPMYLKTEQGSGNYRTRAADELSLALIEYYNKNKIDGSTTTTMLYTLDLESLGLVLYIDELLVTNMSEPIEGIILLSIPSLTTGTWFKYLHSDGTISIYED